MDAVWIYTIVVGVVIVAHVGLFVVLRRLMRDDRRRSVRAPGPPDA